MGAVFGRPGNRRCRIKRHPTPPYFAYKHPCSLITDKYTISLSKRKVHSPAKINPKGLNQKKSGRIPPFRSRFSSNVTMPLPFPFHSTGEERCRRPHLHFHRNMSWSLEVQARRIRIYRHPLVSCLRNLPSLILLLFKVVGNKD